MSALDFLDIEEAPLKPVLDPRVYVEPKDRRSESEIKRQSLTLSALRKHARRMMVFAVPNSARSSGEKLRQFREGAVYGAADLVCVWTGGVAFIEMKAGTTMPRANQVEFLSELARRDQHVAICRTPEGAMAWLKSIGAPVPVREGL